MRRFQAFVLLLTLLAGMLPARPVAARVCAMASASGHCCCPHDAPTAPDCCSIQTAPERAPSHAVLPAPETPAIAPSVTLAPALSPALSLPSPHIDAETPALRGPPGRRRPSRAPPIFS